MRKQGPNLSRNLVNFNEKIGPVDHYFRGTIFHVASLFRCDDRGVFH